jgi:hypothetical protein
VSVNVWVYERGSWKYDGDAEIEKESRTGEETSIGIAMREVVET